MCLYPRIFPDMNKKEIVIKAYNNLIINEINQMLVNIICDVNKENLLDMMNNMIMFKRKYLKKC